MIEKASKLIINSDFTVGLAGARISSESGIPTFRGKMDYVVNLKLKSQLHLKLSIEVQI